MSSAAGANRNTASRACESGGDKSVDAALAHACRLHAAGAIAAQRCISCEAPGMSSVAHRQSASTKRILHRQCAALCQIGQHGMRRIAEQGDAAAGPGRQRRQRVERPLAPRRYAAQAPTSGSDGSSPAARAAWLRRPRRPTRGPARSRARSRPRRSRCRRARDSARRDAWGRATDRPPGVASRPACGRRDHGACRGGAGELGRRHAGQRLANRRPQAVGADQRRARLRSHRQRSRGGHARRRSAQSRRRRSRCAA